LPSASPSRTWSGRPAPRIRAHEFSAAGADHPSKIARVATSAVVGRLRP
jgi:hypothetical protein